MTELFAYVVELAGGEPLFEAARRREICEALAATPFAPELATFDEAAGLRPFSLDEVTQPIPGPTGRQLYLVRQADPEYELIVSLGDRPSLALTAGAARIGAGGAGALFDLADALAAICRPYLGWAHGLADLSPPFADGDARERALLDRGARGGTALAQHGPGGFGMRTYFGPRALERMPPATLLALPPPARAEALAWGGMRVDLCDPPFSADEALLLASSRSARAAVAAVGFFATATVDASGVRFQTPKWWTAELLRSAPAAITAGHAPPAPARGADPLAKLTAAAAAGERLTGSSFRGVAAAGAGLRGLRAERVDLSEGDLRGANLDSAELVDVDFDRANLAGTIFEGALLDQVEFRGADVSGARFADAEVSSCFFRGVKLVGASFSAAQVRLPDFREALLGGATFEEARIADGDFGGADAARARFGGARLERCDFTGANLAGADFSGAELEGCIFSGARLEGATWTGARLGSSTFDPGRAPRA